jgi:hypothetical protein
MGLALDCFHYRGWPGCYPAKITEKKLSHAPAIIAITIAMEI